MGARAGVRNPVNRLEELFPRLRSSPYEVTSPEDGNYNCVAWAARDTEIWWEPDILGLYYWPRGVPRGCTLDAFREAFAQEGYEPCNTRVLEPAQETVAIFVNKAGAPTHAARQLPNGRWTSKLGRAEDIEHDLNALEGDQYGSVALIMKRSSGTPASPEAHS